jgi:hypothetical protein
MARLAGRAHTNGLVRFTAVRPFVNLTSLLDIKVVDDDGDLGDH